MMGRQHVLVGAAAGAGVVTLDHGYWLFVRALMSVRPFELLNAPHALVSAVPNLAAPGLLVVTLPSWFCTLLGVPLAYAVGIGFSAGLALLPDIDSHASTFGKFMPDWIRWLFDMEHRGWTHWWGTGLLFAGLESLIMGGSPMHDLFVHLALGGYMIGHLFCDLVTTEGLPLDPFHRRVVRLPISFDADSPVAPWVAWGMAGLILLWSTGLWRIVFTMHGQSA